MAIVVLGTLPFFVFANAFRPDRVLSPADNLLDYYPWKALAPDARATNPLLTDITSMFHPWLIYAAHEIRHGHFPLWNPHPFLGAPFFANPQTALLFPLTALAYVVPFPLAVTLISVLKLSIAGVAMYWFLRLLAIAPLPAITASIAFMFSGVLIVWLQWSSTTAVVLFPLLFGMTEMLRQRGHPRVVAGLAIVVALELLSGYPQLAVQGLVAATMWALYRGWRTPRWPVFLGRFAAGVALGVGLAAVQLLPFLEYVRESSVLKYRTEWMYRLTLPLRSAMTLLMPHYYGSPVSRDFSGYWNFNEITVSVGLLPLVILPLTLVAAWSRTGTKFFCAMGGLAAAMIYGVPVVADTLAAMPPFSFVITTRIAAFFTLAACVLLGIGLDHMAKTPAANLRVAARAVRLTFVALSGAAFLFVVTHYGFLARRPTRVSALVQYLGFLVLLTLATLVVLHLVNGERRARWWLALIALELASVLPLAASYNPIIPAARFYPGPPESIRRVQTESAGNYGRVLFTTSRVSTANITTLYGLSEAGGYDGMTPRYVEDLVDPQGSLDSQASGALRVTAAMTSPVFDLLGVRYIVAGPDVPRPAPHFSLIYDGSDGRVFRNDRALARAFLAFRVRRCLDDDAAWRLIHDGAVDFRDEVVLAGCEKAPPAGPRHSVANAEITTYSSHDVVVNTGSDAPAYLVLTETWFPGWRAWVDGVEQTIWRANGALRAVWVPAGRHEIEFHYRPASFTYGLALSVFSGLIVVVLLWRRPGLDA